MTWDWNKFGVVGADFISGNLIFERQDGSEWTSEQTLNDLDGHIFKPEIAIIVADLYPWAN